MFETIFNCHGSALDNIYSYQYRQFLFFCQDRSAVSICPDKLNATRLKYMHVLISRGLHKAGKRDITPKDAVQIKDLST